MVVATHRLTRRDGAWSAGTCCKIAALSTLKNSEEQMTTPRKRLYIPTPGGLGSLPFSSGVLMGNTFYLCGHLGLDPATKKIPESVEREIRLMMDGMRDTLEEVGMTMQDLVSVQIFCPDLSLFAQFNETYRTYFTEPFPARAFIGSGPLLFGARFEIQGIAVKD
jgi:2-iminobutanoate/2-iminopropanoate deaminase